MSWEVPIGPLMPRSGYRASRSSSRSRADQHLVGHGGEPLAERRGLRGDVVRAAGHHQGLVLGREPAELARVATTRVRSRTSEERTWSCSTFSVRSREVMPLWMCS